MGFRVFSYAACRSANKIDPIDDCVVHVESTPHSPICHLEDGEMVLQTLSLARNRIIAFLEPGDVPSLLKRCTLTPRSFSTMWAYPE